MCGISGFVNFKSKVEKRQIEAMNEAIQHRGPDGRGIFVGKHKNFHLGFGHVRLAILDLSEKGRQPMGLCLGKTRDKSFLVYDDGKAPDYLVTFNGEIYNFLELRSELEKVGYSFETECDTEVLLKGYEHWGTDVVSKLNGMFAFVIWDVHGDLLFGARDRLGKKPLKYYFDDERFIFCSELKGILTQNVPREIDLNAVDQYLTLQYVPAPLTGFKNIFKLEQASFFILNLKTKEFNTERYWDVPFDKKKSRRKKEWMKQIEDCIDKSVQRRMLTSDVEVGSFLSGGVDSSAVVAFASRYKENLKTFTIQFAEKDFDESECAQKVARQYKTEHYSFTVTANDMQNAMEKIVFQYEEPYADVSQLPTYILAQKTSEKVKVVLNGDGGDENFAGYDRYRIHQIADKMKWLPFTNMAAWICKKLSENVNSALFHQAFVFFKTLRESPAVRHYNYTRYFDTFTKEDFYLDSIKKSINKDSFEAFRKYEKKLPTVEAIQYLDFHTYLPDDLMAKVDIACSAFGLESRSPLLDYKLVEAAAEMPLKYKMKGKKRKKILKEILVDRYLSKDILYRKKQGFDVPVDAWFRSELRDFLNSALLDPKGLVLNLMKRKKVEELLEEHYKGKDNGKKLWVLLTLNLWYRQYFI
ncbi:MAG: asparagine synthase (glutamine-hydrolyzing) [Spirochaetales bacterium]|nr:asparagine synthase (glutamine-hydrolyzing) [Spirochaetales bacterium]